MPAMVFILQRLGQLKEVVRRSLETAAGAEGEVRRTDATFAELDRGRHAAHQTVFAFARVGEQRVAAGRVWTEGRSFEEVVEVSGIGVEE